jgi:hypothetical protein
MRIPCKPENLLKLFEQSKLRNSVTQAAQSNLFFKKIKIKIKIKIN